MSNITPTERNLDLSFLEDIQEVTTHVTPIDRDLQPQVVILDPRGHYGIRPREGGWACHIVFQLGDPSVEGTNGVTPETLLAILQDFGERAIVRGDSQYACLADGAGNVLRNLRSQRMWGSLEQVKE